MAKFEVLARTETEARNKAKLKAGKDNVVLRIRRKKKGGSVFECITRMKR